MMPTVRHWLTELADVYARHAGRHGPNRLLPAEVLPAHDGAPGRGGASPQGISPDRGTAEPSAPQACTPQGFSEEQGHTMAHDAQHGSSPNGHGAVDRDRLRAEIALLEAALHYWQARWHHTPGPSDPGTLRHRIQQTIDLHQQELALKRGLDPR
jgi:hypothetical protein